METRSRTAAINAREAMLHIAVIAGEAVLAAGGVAAVAMGLVLLLG